jgi:hypothetical protein
MEWLSNAFLVHIGWAIGDAAIGLLLLAILGIAALMISAPRWIKQQRCQHQHYRETSACDAICNDCGKNLGFIGRIRDARQR